MQVIGMEEDVSVYDIADHPDFHFRTTDIVIRIWNSENGQNDCENEVRRVKRRFAPSACVARPSLCLSRVVLMMTVGSPHPQTSVGQVSRVDVSSKVEVVWADNSMTIVLPQVRLSPPLMKVLLTPEVRRPLLIFS